MVDNEQTVKAIFFLVFFLIYGGVHLYLFLGANASLALGTRSGISVALLMIIMVLAPIIVHMSEKNGFESFAVFFSWIGYLWMGTIFLLFCLSLVFDCYRILIHMGEHILSIDLSSIIPSARNCFIALLSISIAAALYGYIEALNIRSEKITIMTSKIPEEIKRFRIVQISDLHIGLIVREKRLKRILKEIKAANPDILFSTGDLVDGQADNMSGSADLLRGINPEYGKFAVTGNHEFYAGLTQSLDFTRRAGFAVLRGEGVDVGGFINVAGVDDPTARIYGAVEGIPEKKLFSGFSDDRFTILLKHQPVVLKGSPALFDLQLSGHTHKGQIFPFTLVTRLFFAFNSGCYHLDEGSVLCVSRGAGTWGPPMRFMAPPEITIIDLVHGE
ncbi:MAG: metallophosphoesterase [Deltaproteobacteria bacterium]|nr:metallophosphoesterase [Deltaproteobacteria bacterium]